MPRKSDGGNTPVVEEAPVEVATGTLFWERPVVEVRPKFENGFFAGMPLDTFITVEVPGGDIEEGGVIMIKESVKETFNVEMPEDFQYVWQNERGNITKRIQQVLFKAGHKKIDAAWMGALGAQLKAYCANESKVHTIRVEEGAAWSLSPDWTRDPTNPNSCFFNHNKRMYAIVDHYGGCIAYYPNGQTVVDYNKIIGRVWVFPQFPTDDSFMLFNAYGTTLLEAARMVSFMSGLSYRMMGVKGDENIYTNNARGYFVGPVEEIKRHNFKRIDDLRTLVRTLPEYCPSCDVMVYGRKVRYAYCANIQYRSNDGVLHAGCRSAPVATEKCYYCGETMVLPPKSWLVRLGMTTESRKKATVEMTALIDNDGVETHACYSCIRNNRLTECVICSRLVVNNRKATINVQRTDGGLKVGVVCPHCTKAGLSPKVCAGWKRYGSTRGHKCTMLLEGDAERCIDCQRKQDEFDDVYAADMFRTLWNTPDPEKGVLHNRANLLARIDVLLARGERSEGWNDYPRIFDAENNMWYGVGRNPAFSGRIEICSASGFLVASYMRNDGGSGGGNEFIQIWATHPLVQAVLAAQGIASGFSDTGRYMVTRATYKGQTFYGTLIVTDPRVLPGSRGSGWLTVRFEIVNGKPTPTPLPNFGTTAEMHGEEMVAQYEYYIGHGQ